MPAMLERVKGWIPTRENIAANRWLAPYAGRLLHTSLWRFNRRSVPRAIALGLFLAPIVPIAHTLVAALLAVPTRANLVLAILATWVINPLTIPLFYYEAYRVGVSLLRLDAVNPASAVVSHPARTAGTWLSKIIDVSGPAALGTVVLATLMASIGYVLAGQIWRWRVGRRWAKRGRARA
jgi:uncharacterized protein